MNNSTEIRGIADGVAALSVCESLLLAMGDLKIMGEKEAVGIITDAANAHRGAGSTSQDRPSTLRSSQSWIGSLPVAIRSGAPEPGANGI